MTGILHRCKCSNAGQDAMYGKSVRVMNQTRKQDGKVYRCTVCQTEHSFGSGDEKKKKGKKD